MSHINENCCINGKNGNAKCTHIGKARRRCLSTFPADEGVHVAEGVEITVITPATTIFLTGGMPIICYEG